MDELIKLIKNKKLDNQAKILDYCNNSKFDEIANFAADCYDCCFQGSDTTLEPSPFNFIASTSYSGSDYPCNSPFHRLNQVQEMTQFAALYATTVTIYNPFDFAYFALYNKNIKDFSEYGIFRLRADLASALLITNYCEPLIKARLLRYSNTINYLTNEQRRKEHKIYDDLRSNLFKTNIKYVRSIINSEPILISEKHTDIYVENSLDIVGEDLVLEFNHIPDFVYANNGRKTVSKNNINQEIASRLLKPAINSIITQAIQNRNTYSKYLTGNKIERRILTTLDAGKILYPKELVAQGVPIIGSKSINKVLEIRNKNENQFKSFQKHIDNLMGYYKNFDDDDKFSKWVNSELIDDLTEIKIKQQELIKKSINDAIMITANFAISTQFDEKISLPISIYQAINELKSIYKEVENIEKIPAYFYYKIMR